MRPFSFRRPGGVASVAGQAVGLEAEGGGRHDPWITLASMLPCPLAALATIRQTTRELLAVGGIGLMHCTGMQAMQMKAELRCDPVMFGVSITVAAVLATLALWVKFFEPISERRTPTE